MNRNRLLAILLLTAMLLTLSSCVADWENWYDMIPDVEGDPNVPDGSDIRDPSNVLPPKGDEDEDENDDRDPSHLISPDECEAHTFRGNVCIYCYKLEMTAGLTTSIDYSNQTCGIAGLGTCTADTVYLSTTFDNYFNYPIKKVDAYAFAHEEHLRMVALDEGFHSINTSAFEGCYNLTSVVLPESIKSIGNYAFNNCTNLSAVYYRGTPAQWDEIYIISGNDYLDRATVYFNSQWKYVDGIPTLIQ